MKNKVDITTIVGLIIAVGGLGVGYFLEGGDFKALLAISPIIIIFGGTFGFVIVTLPMSTIKRIPGIFKSVFTEKDYDYIALINQLCEWAGTARKQGIVALDKAKDEVTDPFLKRGLTLVVDSIEPEAVKDFLETDIGQTMERHKQNAGIFDQAGAAAPTMGIMGTVLGLVVILAGLGNSSTAELGHGIATAFLATLMGVASANLVYIPFSTKLKNKSAKEILYREISTHGILAIQANESPIILKERLLSYLPDHLKAKGRGE